MLASLRHGLQFAAAGRPHSAQVGESTHAVAGPRHGESVLSAAPVADTHPQRLWAQSPAPRPAAFRCTVGMAATDFLAASARGRSAAVFGVGRVAAGAAVAKAEPAAVSKRYAEARRIAQFTVPLEVDLRDAIRLLLHTFEQGLRIEGQRPSPSASPRPPYRVRHQPEVAHRKTCQRSVIELHPRRVRVNDASASGAAAAAQTQPQTRLETSSSSLALGAAAGRAAAATEADTPLATETPLSAPTAGAAVRASSCPCRIALRRRCCAARWAAATAAAARTGARARHYPT